MSGVHRQAGELWGPHGKPGFVQEAREVPSGCVPSWSLTRLAWDARGLKAL